MELRLVLIHNSGASPALVVADRLPDAPIGFEWPYEDGLPLFFFRKLDLADL